MRDYTKIEAWKLADDLTVAVYQCTQAFPREEIYGLTSQLRRASYSVPANIAEGYGRRSDKEFSNFLNIAHGSIAETQSHLYVALDLNYLNQIDFETLYGLFDEGSKMVMSLTKHLKAPMTP